MHDESFFLFNDTATTEIYTLSLHDALPISAARRCRSARPARARVRHLPGRIDPGAGGRGAAPGEWRVGSAANRRPRGGELPLADVRRGGSPDLPRPAR